MRSRTVRGRLSEHLTQRLSKRRLVRRDYSPESPSPEWLTGFAAGQIEGQLSTAAIVLGLLTDQSPTRILEEARSQAAVQAAFPFDLHVHEDGERWPRTPPG